MHSSQAAFTPLRIRHVLPAILSPFILHNNWSNESLISIFGLSRLVWRWRSYLKRVQWSEKICLSPLSYGMLKSLVIFQYLCLMHLKLSILMPIWSFQSFMSTWFGDGLCFQEWSSCSWRCAWGTKWNPEWFAAWVLGSLSCTHLLFTIIYFNTWFPLFWSLDH